MNKLRLKVEDFRAISKADIILNGITVLSGINGTGKSTLSILLYKSIKLTLDYEKKRIHNFYNNWERILTSLSILSQDFQINYLEIRNSLDNIKSIDIAYEILISNINKIEYLFITRNKDIAFKDNEIKRIANLLERPLLLEYEDQKKKEYNCIEDVFIEAKKNINKEKKEVEEILKTRPLNLLFNQMNQYFSTNDILLGLYEDEIPVIDLNQTRLNNLFSVDNVIYIDTPMSLNNIIPNRVYYDNSHWESLIELINKKTVYNTKEDEIKINTSISNIISGKVQLDDKGFNQRMIYERKDGLKIDLEETATGIKSFAILQLLLSKGILNDKTLVILDEPEAHLHPQWIVEYAKIIVSLNKYLGVKFMIATHNPDMVSSLKYISEKEKTIKTLNFYLAEKHKTKEQYIFKNYKRNIDPIFSSFNIALDKISEYGI